MKDLARLKINFTKSTNGYEISNIIGIINDRSYSYSEMFITSSSNVFDEVPDRGGCDMMVMENKTMHRIQIKLGVSPLGKDHANKLSIKSLHGKMHIENWLKAKSIDTNPKIECYILTTRKLTKEAITLFEKESIKIIDQKKIISMGLWPQEVLEWAKSYALSQNYDDSLDQIEASELDIINDDDFDDFEEEEDLEEKEDDDDDDDDNETTEGQIDK